MMTFTKRRLTFSVFSQPVPIREIHFGSGAREAKAPYAGAKKHRELATMGRILPSFIRPGRA